jgi:hypothetical protein
MVVNAQKPTRSEAPLPYTPFIVGEAIDFKFGDPES